MSYTKESYFPHFAIRWVQLYAQSDSALVFEEVYRAYSEPHRGHHNFQHIIECQTMLDMIEGKFQNPLEASLAFLFHDVVYDPGRNDNEEESALFFISKAETANIPAGKIALIAELIRLSKPGSKLITNDQRYFHDIDFSVLGSPWPRYLQYADGIKKEYQTVYSPEAYRKGGCDFLQGLVGKSRIFETDEFHEQFDSLARQNAKKEIEHLSLL